MSISRQIKPYCHPSTLTVIQSPAQLPHKSVSLRTPVVEHLLTSIEMCFVWIPVYMCGNHDVSVTFCQEAKTTNHGRKWCQATREVRVSRYTCGKTCNKVASNYKSP